MIVSTTDSHLMIFDIFEESQQFQAKLDFKIVSMAINEEKNSLYAALENQREIFIYNINNLDLIRNKVVEMPFESFLRELPKNFKDHYLMSD